MIVANTAIMSLEMRRSFCGPSMPSSLALNGPEYAVTPIYNPHRPIQPCPRRDLSPSCSNSNRRAWPWDSQAGCWTSATGNG